MAEPATGIAVSGVSSASFSSTSDQAVIRPWVRPAGFVALTSNGVDAIAVIDVIPVSGQLPPPTGDRARSAALISRSAAFRAVQLSDSELPVGWAVNVSGVTDKLDTTGAVTTSTVTADITVV